MSFFVSWGFPKYPFQISKQLGLFGDWMQLLFMILHVQNENFILDCTRIFMKVFHILDNNHTWHFLTIPLNNAKGLLFFLMRVGYQSRPGTA
jgi:hypothetical protein